MPRPGIRLSPERNHTSVNEQVTWSASQTVLLGLTGKVFFWPDLHGRILPTDATADFPALVVLVPCTKTAGAELALGSLAFYHSDRSVSQATKTKQGSSDA